MLPRAAKGHGAAAIEVASLLWRHRELTYAMARRELSDRYAGQALGVGWALWHPLFLIGLYIFVFAVVFRQRIGGTVEMPLDYTTYLLSGLVAWLSIQESMIKSCTAITANASLVKQVVFPLEVLPAKGVLVSLVPQIVSLALLTGYVLVTNGSVPATYLLFPVLIAVQSMLMLGIAYVLAPIGVYVRDVKDFVQLFATAGAYLVPVFYLPQWVPDVLRPLIYLNPFSYVIWCYQDALYYGRFAHPWAWVIFLLMSVTMLTIGYRAFRKLKPTLGNLL